MITLLLAHPMLTKAAIALVACRKVAGVAYLAADVNTNCGGSEYLSWLGLAVPCFYSSPLAFPPCISTFFAGMWPKETLDANREVYGYLTSGYQEGAYWFELWNTVRKGLFTVFALVFAPLGALMQTWAALLLLLLYLAVFLMAQPYEVQYLNSLETQALSANILTLLCGLGLFNNDLNDDDNRSEAFATVLSLFVVAFNTVFLARLFVVLYRHSEYLGSLRDYVAGNEFVQSGVLMLEARSRSWSRSSRRSTSDVELSDLKWNVESNPFHAAGVARTTPAPASSIGARTAAENPASETQESM